MNLLDRRLWANAPVSLRIISGIFVLLALLLVWQGYEDFFHPAVGVTGFHRKFDPIHDIGDAFLSVCWAWGIISFKQGIRRFVLFLAWGNLVVSAFMFFTLFWEANSAHPFAFKFGRSWFSLSVSGYREPWSDVLTFVVCAWVILTLMAAKTRRLFVSSY